jgi:HAD superfamily hydrolase (TIGR01509 family)
MHVGARRWQRTDYDGVIFDCDGVLVDSERIANGVWARLLTQIGVPMTTDESMALFMGNSMARCVEIVTAMRGAAPPDDLLERYEREVTDAFERDIVAIDGIANVLDALDAARVPYCVASNGEHARMHTTLGKTGLLARFEGHRFSSADVARPKPAPDLFLFAARAMHFAPARTIVVEDSALGVTGAAAAGMHVIGFAATNHAQRLLDAGAIHVIDRLSTLTALLGLSA